MRRQCLSRAKSGSASHAVTVKQLFRDWSAVQGSAIAAASARGIESVSKESHMARYKGVTKVEERAVGDGELARTPLSEDESKFLSELGGLGGAAGNTTLMRKLRWADDRYWDVRDKLLREGLLELGRGKGGSVRRIQPVSEVIAETATEAREERALYDPIMKVLRDVWVRKIKDYRFDDIWVETMAHQGRRQTGGKWSRPDLALVGLTNYPYLPGKFLDVITFEVKPEDAIDVSAVYEALAHRRGATRSYVLLQMPKKKDAIEPTLTVVRDEAVRHGIGVIEFTDPADVETWEETVEAERVAADPQRLNEFINVQFSAAVKDELIRRAK